MIKIISARGTGKTHRLLDEAKRANGLVVCSNPAAMRKKSEYYGIKDLHFISYSEFLDSKNIEDKNVFIDELDQFLLHINKYILGYTITIED